MITDMSATNKTDAMMTRRTRLDIKEMILPLIFVFWTILFLIAAQGLLISPESIPRNVPQFDVFDPVIVRSLLRDSSFCYGRNYSPVFFWATSRI
jgi:hypothetical protein